MDADLDFYEKVYEREHGLPWRILETERCYLREETAEDLDRLYEIYAGPGITDYLEPLFPREEEEAYLEAYIDQVYRFYGYGMWMVCRKSDDVIIGRAGLEYKDYGDYTGLEMGYLIAAEEQGKGYATEVCAAIMDYAWENLDFSELNCVIEEENIPSVRLARRLGFCQIEQAQGPGKPSFRYIFN